MSFDINGFFKLLPDRVSGSGNLQMSFCYEVGKCTILYTALNKKTCLKLIRNFQVTHLFNSSFPSRLKFFLFCLVFRKKGLTVVYNNIARLFCIRLFSGLQSLDFNFVSLFFAIPRFVATICLITTIFHETNERKKELENLNRNNRVTVIKTTLLFRLPSKSFKINVDVERLVLERISRF